MTKREEIAYGAAKHLIVDIETMGIQPPAPILTIGMVVLDYRAAVEGVPAVRTFYLGVDPKDCLGAVNIETLRWWERQVGAVRKAAFNTVITPNALQAVADIMTREAPDYFWGNSPDFDYGHLEAQFDAKGIDCPWNFWALRDIRTIKGLCLGEGEGELMEKGEVMSGFAPHHALYDALKEAQILKTAIDRLRAAGLM